MPDTNDGRPQLPPEGTIPPLPTVSEFEDSVVVVTGGTDGLGRHLTKTLCSFGAHVFFCGRSREKADAVLAQCRARGHFMRLDLADPEATREFVRSVGTFRGSIDYVVNNAAVDARTPVHEVDVETFDTLVAVNLRAQFLVCQAAVPFLEEGAGKAIVNIGTTNWMHGWSGMSVYSASKSGLLGMTRTLARDFGPKGIRVNMVSPGWIMTERQLADHIDGSAMRDLVETQCVKSLLDEQFVTPATLFMLSRASGGMSGQNLVVDGGKHFQ